MKRLIQKGLSEFTLSGAPINWEQITLRRVLSFLFKKKAYQRLFRLLVKLYYFILRKIKVFIGLEVFENRDYSRWRKKYTPSPNDLREYKSLIPKFNFQPTYNLIIRINIGDLDFLNECCTSVLNQVYDNWKLFIHFNITENNDLTSYLKKLESEHTKIELILSDKLKSEVENINNTINKLEGEYAIFIDSKDTLALEALFEITKSLNQNPENDIIYSDNDTISEHSKYLNPNFKPDWSPENLLSSNYISNLCAIKTEKLKEVKLHSKHSGALLYDLILRLTEETQKIKHIPKVLYHSRLESGNNRNTSSNNSAHLNALIDALKRRGIAGSATFHDSNKETIIARPELKKEYRVSIIIPSKDKAYVLKTCIDSIINKSSYKNYEIIVVDNNSSEDSFHELISYYSNNLGDRFKCVRISEPFNFSLLINQGEINSNGEYLLLLNNDMEIITPDWIEKMLEYAQLKDIGAVGVKLLYHNNTIQHAGTVLGLGGIAGNTFIGFDRISSGYHNALQSIRNYSALTAACLMIKREKFKQVNGFTEILPIEFNDVDFCLKLIEANYRNIYLPHVSLYHYESLSRGHPHDNRESHEQQIKDIKYMKNHWQKYLDNDPCYSPNLTKKYTNFEIQR